MAPQQKKTAPPKKIPAKKTSPKKTSLKKTAPKKTGSKKMVTKKMSPKTTPKKTSPKKTAPKKTLPKKAALKKKIASKRSAKVGERLAKKDTAKGKKTTTSKNEERAARAAKRSLAKEAPATKKPQRKRARLDSSSDLVNLLTTSAPVRDIFAASGSRHLPIEDTKEEAVGKGAFKDVSYELDHLLEASTASASVQDIIAASGSMTFPNEAFAEDDEAGGSKIAGYELDGLLGTLWGSLERYSGSGPLVSSGSVSASVLDIIAASGTSPLPRELPAEEAAFNGEDQGSLVAENATSNTRPRKVYVSPALLWLEEEGLPTAEKEAQDKALEGEMDKEAVLRRAMGRWKSLSMEEKVVWRKRAEELANTNKK